MAERLPVLVKAVDTVMYISEKIKMFFLLPVLAETCAVSRARATSKQRNRMCSAIDCCMKNDLGSLSLPPPSLYLSCAMRFWLFSSCRAPTDASDWQVDRGYTCIATSVDFLSPAPTQRAQNGSFSWFCFDGAIAPLLSHARASAAAGVAAGGFAVHPPHTLPIFPSVLPVRPHLF